MVVRLSTLYTGHNLLLRNIAFFASGTHLCWRLSEPQGLVRLEEFGKLKKFTSLGLEEPVTLQIAACSIVL
jgi:hypothetical protein